MTLATPSRLVELDQVDARRGRRVVLTGLDLSLDAGECVLVCGRNGCGKTTLLRVVAGLVTPSKGHRQVHGELAFVPAALAPPPTTVKGWLGGFRERASDPLRALDHLGFVGSSGTPLASLSFGNLRKVVLAEAFSSYAKTIVIDEAAIGLDEAGVSGLVSLVSEATAGGRAVILSSQSVDEVRWNPRILELVDGSLRPRSQHTSLRFTGPASQALRLVELAEELGFFAEGGT